MLIERRDTGGKNNDHHAPIVNNRENNEPRALPDLDGIIQQRIEEEKKKATPISFLEFWGKFNSKEITQPKSSADLLYQAMTTPAPRELPTGYFEYPFFSERPDKFAVHGLHGVLTQIADFVHAGDKERGLLLVGESGAGKSVIVEALKRGLVEYSRSMSNPIYKIQGCPIQEQPFNLLDNLLTPEQKRQVHHEHGIEINELCPDCQLRLKEAGKDTGKIMVEPLEFSQSTGEGIGKIDQKLTKTKYDGNIEKIIKHANRGILDIPELFLQGEWFLYSLPDLVRGRRMPQDGKQYDIDALVLAQTTHREHKENMSKYATLLNRFETVLVPFNQSSREEGAIYKTAFETKSSFPIVESVTEMDAKEKAIHISARARDVFAEYAVLTRMNEPDNTQGEGIKLTIAEKFQLQNGEPVNGYSPKIVRELDEQERIKEKGDGRIGISPADMEANILLMTARERKESRECINPIKALALLSEQLKGRRDITNDRKRQIEAVIREQNDQWLVDSIRHAYVPNYEELRAGALNEYLDNVKAEILKQKIQDPYSGDLTSPNITLFKEIEANAGGDGKGSKQDSAALRQEVFYKVSAKEGRIGFSEAPEWLKKGIDGKVFGGHNGNRKMQEVLRQSFAVEASASEGTVFISNGNEGDNKIDKEAKKKYQQMKDVLIKEDGFCEHCVAELLQYASSNNLLEKHK
jgi:serine protein kinase